LKTVSSIQCRAMRIFAAATPRAARYFAAASLTIRTRSARA
jgi:hypothetical protein